MKKILVVDDDDSVLDAMSLILEEAGYQVEITIKGEETHAKVAVFKPDVILLDVLLSGKDGRAICRKLKQDPKTRQIPVVMISAHPSAEKSVNEYRADGFLAKPFEIEELLAVITKHTTPETVSTGR